MIYLLTATEIVAKYNELIQKIVKHTKIFIDTVKHCYSYNYLFKTRRKDKNEDKIVQISVIQHTME